MSALPEAPVREEAIRQCAQILPDRFDPLGEQVLSKPDVLPKLIEWFTKRLADLGFEHNRHIVLIEPSHCILPDGRRVGIQGMRMLVREPSVGTGSDRTKGKDVLLEGEVGAPVVMVNSSNLSGEARFSQITLPVPPGEVHQIIGLSRNLLLDNKASGSIQILNLEFPLLVGGTEAVRTFTMLEGARPDEEVLRNVNPGNVANRGVFIYQRLSSSDAKLST
ncbi:MAG: hypothetical protein AAB588_01650 [Patescibacteria group bacterium]